MSSVNIQFQRTVGFLLEGGGGSTENDHEFPFAGDVEDGPLGKHMALFTWKAEIVLAYRQAKTLGQTQLRGTPYAILMQLERPIYCRS